MKNYIANVFIYKEKNVNRKNFLISSDSESEDTLKSLIKDKLDLNTDKYEFVEEKYELISKENVIIFETIWKKKNIEEKLEKVKFDFEKVKNLKN